MQRVMKFPLQKSTLMFITAFHQHLIGLNIMSYMSKVCFSLVV